MSVGPHSNHNMDKDQFDWTEEVGCLIEVIENIIHPFPVFFFFLILKNRHAR